MLTNEGVDIEALCQLIFSDPPFASGIQGIDDALGGGIPLEKITEVHGLPGTGRFCFWYCVLLPFHNVAPVFRPP